MRETQSDKDLHALIHFPRDHSKALNQEHHSNLPGRRRGSWIFGHAFLCQVHYLGAGSGTERPGLKPAPIKEVSIADRGIIYHATEKVHKIHVNLNKVIVKAQKSNEGRFGLINRTLIHLWKNKTVKSRNHLFSIEIVSFQANLCRKRLKSVRQILASHIKPISWGLGD